MVSNIRQPWNPACENTSRRWAYCQPDVHAIIAAKFGAQGVFRGGTVRSAWRDPASIAVATQAPSEATVAATVAFCEYVYSRYGRFPAYAPPFRTVLGFQATHVDTEFYDHSYRPEALTDLQRQHLARWHENRV